MPQTPTERELEILKVLWQHGEATVRQVYEELRAQDLPIVQNTVQAFLRTMEEKLLVDHRVEGRSFVYRPLVQPGGTQSALASKLLGRVFDGAIGQLVRSVFDAQPPTEAELDELQTLIENAREQTASKIEPPAETKEGES